MFTLLCSTPAGRPCKRGSLMLMALAEGPNAACVQPGMQGATDGRGMANAQRENPRKTLYSGIAGNKD
jgi:hypothetical protein